MKIQLDKFHKYITIVEAFAWWVTYCENDIDKFAEVCINQLKKAHEKIPQVREQIDELIQLIETYVSLPTESKDYACELLDTIDMKFKYLLYTSAKVL